MKSIVWVGLALSSFNLLADTIVSKVHSVDAEYGFVRFENGRVAFINKAQKSNPYHLQMLTGQTVKAVMDENNELKSMNIQKKIEEEKPLPQKSLFNEPPAFEPTVLPDQSAVKNMYDRLNSDFKRVSECSDRAHVWAYDEFKNHGIKTQKVFAFFTASYINRNRFKWWFHVAPLVHVRNGGGTQQLVLDYQYKDRPVPIKEWTDMMVFSKRECKMTTRFSEYDVNPQTEDCYMMIDSMYYRLPGDLHRQELEGVYRDGFNESEVNSSRRFAFERGGV